MGAIVTQTNDLHRIRITIPGDSLGARLHDLIMPSLPEGTVPIAVKIMGLLPDGVSQRAVFQAASPRFLDGARQAITGSDFTNDGEGVAVGVDWYEPADADCQSYVRAPGGDAPAVVVVFF